MYRFFIPSEQRLAWCSTTAHDMSLVSHTGSLNDPEMFSSSSREFAFQCMVIRHVRHHPSYSCEDSMKTQRTPVFPISCAQGDSVWNCRVGYGRLGSLHGTSTSMRARQACDPIFHLLPHAVEQIQRGVEVGQIKRIGTPMHLQPVIVLHFIVQSERCTIVRSPTQIVAQVASQHLGPIFSRAFDCKEATEVMRQPLRKVIETEKVVVHDATGEFSH